MTAAEPGLGWQPGTFVAAYSDNQREVEQTAFESDPVAIEICRLVEPLPYGWEGTAAELLDALTEHAPESATKLKTWPATAQGLGNRLMRCAPLVRANGYNIEKRHSGNRTIRISPIAKRGAEHVEG
jgi:putative DNA primase/helicase